MEIVEAVMVTLHASTAPHVTLKFGPVFYASFVAQLASLSHQTLSEADDHGPLLPVPFY